ncbi:MAG: hypothetical protein K2G70_05480 [Turicibacter sp.]|nr:hypothetical protein [Turicibacter sp.]
MNKKKGSTMITILIFMTFIIMVGVVSLAVVANDFKMRMNDSKNVAHLYEAESGLDMAYNVLVKVFNYAVDVANDAVESEFKETLDLAESQEAMNTLFQDTFIQVFESSYNIDGETKELLAACLATLQYPVFNAQPIEFTIDKDVKISVIQTKDENTFNFNFDSRFVTDEGSERHVSVQYALEVPTYQGAMQQKLEKVTISEHPAFVDSVINIGGNAMFTGTVDITGQVRVKGTEVEIIDPIYGKYASGITLKAGNLTIDGDMITNETVSLNQNAKASVTGNIFARNVYVGKSPEDTALETNANLEVTESLFLDNDLVVNVQPSLNGSVTSTVVANNLYGLNDKNTLDENGTPSRESSSLIVNSEGATVTIEEDTYLSGVAYINTKEPYQTGESVAIRGNYLAYTQLLPGWEGFVQMKYYNPLLLVETINGNSSAQAKAEYFVQAASNGDLTLSNGGVSLNPDKVHTVGAWVSQDELGQDKVGSSSFSEEDIKTLDEKRTDYASQVFNMGMPVDSHAYEIGKILKTISTDPNSPSQIKFEALKNEDLTFNNYYGDVIWNTDENMTILIQENEFGTNDIIYLQNDLEIDRVIDVTKAIVMTAGDVEIHGNVDFIGNIIAAGNLSVTTDEQTDEKVQLTFDKIVTNRIIASNYESFKKVFNITATNTLNKAIVEVVVGAKRDEMETKYYAEDYIQVGRWQLLK